MLNVLLIPNAFSDELSPGGGIFHVEQAKALMRRGVFVSTAFICFRSLRTWKTGQWTDYCKKLVCGTRDSVPFTELRFWNPGAFCLRFALRRLYFAKLLKAHMNKHGKPDIIHIHFGPWAGLAVHAIKRLCPDVPVVLTEHSSQVGMRALGPFQKHLLRGIYRSVDSLTAVSGHLAKQVQEIADKPVAITPNFIESPPTWNSIQNRTHKAVTIGSLTQLKRQADILRALARLPHGLTLQLDVYGDGPERRNLELLASHLRLANIRFHGFAPKDTILRALSESDMLIHASDYETFGCVFIEAMAMGTPIIAAQAPGAEEMVKSGVGLTYKARSCHALTDAISRFYNPTELFDRRAIRSVFETQYSADVVCGKLIELYEDASKRN